MTVADDQRLSHFRPRILGGPAPAAPREVSIFGNSDGIFQSVHRAEIGNENGGKGHGLLSRPSASVHGEVAPTSGWPFPIRRFASFAVLPPASLPVNVITGVPSRPAAGAPNRRRNSLTGRR